MTSRILTIVLSLGCGCNSLYLLDGGSAGTSTGMGTSTGIELSTGTDATPTTGLTEATAGDSTTWMVVSISSTSETSTSTSETSTSTDGTSTSTGDSSSGDGPETTSGDKKVRLVFLTSQKFDGTMGLGEPGLTGLERADNQCQSLAAAAMLKGTFRAWLSSGSASAGDRTKGDGEFPSYQVVLTNGEAVVAEDWQRFKSQEHLAAMTLTENGEEPEYPDYLFWSGTKANGNIVESQLNCSDWKLGVFPWEGRVGNAQMTDNTWSNDKSEYCNEWHRLLCIQISFEDPPAP